MFEAILNEYKANNAKADRQRPEDKKYQKWTLLWVAAYTIVTGAILGTSIWQSVSVQRQLNAALTGQRAWISIEPKVSSPISFDALGGHFDLDIVFKNVGHSPATRMSAAAKGSVLISGHVYDQEGILESVCQKVDRNIVAQVSLFPGEDITERRTVDIDPEDVQLGIIQGSEIWGSAIIPLVYVCAVYDDPGSGPSYMRTAFTYTVGVKGDRPGILKTVPLEAGKIPPDGLGLRRDFWGGSLVK